MKMPAVTVAILGSAAFMALSACQNSTAVLTPTEPAKPLAQNAGETAKVAKPKLSNLKPVDLTVSLKQAVSESIKVCTSNGAKFQRSRKALADAGYRINPPVKQGAGKKAATLREAYSADGKYIVKLGTAFNGFRSCQVLFRSQHRTARRIADAIAAEKRLVRFVQGKTETRYRFAETGHIAEIRGPYTSRTSKDVGLLFVISEKKTS